MHLGSVTGSSVPLCPLLRNAFTLQFSVVRRGQCPLSAG